MSFGILEKFIKEYLELPVENYTFSWHGGEPLLAGLPFFEQIVKLQEKHRKKDQLIRNLVQTNGTLLDRRWAEFFKKHNFGIGVSLDGIKENHDMFRQDLFGRGTFDSVLRGIDILRDRGIEPGFLQTVTGKSVYLAEENFRFFTEKIQVKSWAINPYFDVTGTNKSMEDQQLFNDGFISLLKKYSLLWLARDDENLRIREIDELLAGVLERSVFSICNLNIS